jgi:hypothetical protein
MRKLDLIIRVPSKTAPTAPNQPDTGAFIFANSAEFTFGEAVANTAAIESEIAETKEIVAKQPKERRRLRWLARLVPERARAIVEWLVANGKTNVAGKSAGRPLDDDLPYELARFYAFMNAGKYKSERKAAIALCGDGRAQPLQTKLSIFGRAFAFSRKARIVRGPGIFEETIMSRDPNDDRSDTMNPNNDAYWDSLDNHADQLNPNNDEYRSPDGDED